MDKFKSTIKSKSQATLKVHKIFNIIGIHKVETIFFSVVIFSN